MNSKYGTFNVAVREDIMQRFNDKVPLQGDRVRALERLLKYYTIYGEELFGDARIGRRFRELVTDIVVDEHIDVIMRERLPDEKV